MLDKVYYNAKEACDDASNKKRLSHIGPRMNVSQLKCIDSIISPLVKKGQSLEHIYHFHNEIHNVSISSIRRMIDNGWLSINRAGLRRARRYAKKYHYHRSESQTDLKAKNRAGRTFSDYRKYKESNSDFVLAELDSVVGTMSDKKKLFTFMLVDCKFQIGKLYLSSNSAEEVNSAVREIIKIIKPYLNNKTLILLSDNGTEFDRLPEVEEDNVKVFYTNAYRSTDKAHCERNHELFRYVIPKGYSLDSFTQDDIDKIFSNINSYARKEIEWKSPCELFTEAYSAEALPRLGIVRIDPDDVDLSPKF